MRAMLSGRDEHARRADHGPGLRVKARAVNRLVRGQALGRACRVLLCQKAGVRTRPTLTRRSLVQSPNLERRVPAVAMLAFVARRPRAGRSRWRHTRRPGPALRVRGRTSAIGPRNLRPLRSEQCPRSTEGLTSDRPEGETAREWGIGLPRPRSDIRLAGQRRTVSPRPEASKGRG
jgi:hypothetical protein